MTLPWCREGDSAFAHLVSSPACCRVKRRMEHTQTDYLHTLTAPAFGHPAVDNIVHWRFTHRLVFTDLAKNTALLQEDLTPRRLTITD